MKYLVVFLTVALALLAPSPVVAEPPTNTVENVQTKMIVYCDTSAQTIKIGMAMVEGGSTSAWALLGQLNQQKNAEGQPICGANPYQGQMGFAENILIGVTTDQRRLWAVHVAFSSGNDYWALWAELIVNPPLWEV